VGRAARRGFRVNGEVQCSKVMNLLKDSFS
jgi:hypothetical protein